MQHQLLITLWPSIKLSDDGNEVKMLGVQIFNLLQIYLL